MATKRPRRAAPRRQTRSVRPPSKGKARGKLSPRGESRTARSAVAAPLTLQDPRIEQTLALVREAGGTPIGAYREPFNGLPLLLALLPLRSVQPTPFQRDLSPTHTRRLAEKIEQTGVFLDPLIVVRGEDGRLWTPNGRHRLAAAKFLRLAQVPALVSADERLAYRILALNTEKAHNLKDRSLEAIRMARSLAVRRGRDPEGSFADEFESPELLTLGAAYERDARFAGGAYSPVLKKVDRFSDQPLAKSLRAREDYASRLCEIERNVAKIVATLTARGMRSPYLRNYVVARINPVRFHKVQKGATRPPMPLSQALTRMAAAARRFDTASVSQAELAWLAAGAQSQD